MTKKTVFALVVVFLLVGCASLSGNKPEIEDAGVIFYPPLPERPRLQFLQSIRSEDDLGNTQGAMETFLLGEKQSNKELERPYDVASSKGKIYVLDRRFKKLVIIDLINKTFELLKDTRLGTLNEPSGIWVSEDDIKYVADMKRKQIVVFDRSNEFLRTYGDQILFEKPVDVVVYENTVYVADMEKNKVVILDKNTGKHLGDIGKTGKKEGELFKPTHLTVDRSGNLFVNDAFNYRVQKFDPAGKYLKAYGQLGDTVGSLARPKGIAVDREGRLYVADAAFENAQIFDEQSGQLLMYFGGSGRGPGNMYLPSGLHMDYDNIDHFRKFTDKDFRLKYLLYVTNSFGPNKLNIYGFGEWIGEMLPEDNNKNIEQDNNKVEQGNEKKEES